MQRLKLLGLLSKKAVQGLPGGCWFDEIPGKTVAVGLPVGIAVGSGLVAAGYNNVGSFWVVSLVLGFAVGVVATGIAVHSNGHSFLVVSLTPGLAAGVVATVIAGLTANSFFFTFIKR